MAAPPPAGPVHGLITSGFKQSYAIEKKARVKEHKTKVNNNITGTLKQVICSEVKSKDNKGGIHYIWGIPMEKPDAPLIFFIPAIPYKYLAYTSVKCDDNPGKSTLVTRTTIS